MGSSTRKTSWPTDDGTFTGSPNLSRMVSPNSYTRRFRRMLNSQQKGGDIPPQTIFVIMRHNGERDAGGGGVEKNSNAQAKRKGGKKLSFVHQRQRRLCCIFIYCCSTLITPAFLLQNKFQALCFFAPLSGVLHSKGAHQDEVESDWVWMIHGTFSLPLPQHS